MRKAIKKHVFMSGSELQNLIPLDEEEAARKFIYSANR